ncbi:MAG: lipoate--protein ligase family protein [Candidatus Limnocylindrales bacterium]|nr:lipoate--protein ligase family protein [Candidatus Limnocylindrales bacterium]
MDAPFRYIADDGQREPRCNLAVDEALARAAGPEPALRFWRNDRCVILGRFQLAGAEVDLGAAHRLGVPVYRRFTGGGAVYHDAGNLNVSLVAPRDHPLVERRLGAGLQGLYGALLEPLAAAVRTLGIPAGAAPRGLFVGGRKLGGIAAWVGARSVLVHATLLIDADLVALERVLAGPGDPGNRRWQLTKSERTPVTSLARELDGSPAAGGGSPRRPDLRAAVDRAVLHAFMAAACGPTERRIEPGGLRSAERAVAADLLRNRYGEPAWHASG